MDYPEMTWQCPNFLWMVIQMHDNKCGQIILNGDLSEHFPITIGVKHGCVMAPNFFNMVLMQATDDVDGCMSGTV